MIVVRILILVVGIAFIEYLVVGKCIQTEIYKYANEYSKKNTLYYQQLQEINRDFSLSPSMLKRAYKLVTAIEREAKEEENEDKKWICK